jgi:hypothetical protein
MHFALILVLLIFFFICWFLQRFHHVLFEGFLFEYQAILIPDKIRHLLVEPMSLHAALKLRKNVAVVRIRSEAELATIEHKLFKFDGLIEAELVDGDLHLFTLDVVVLFVFGAARQSLPRKRPSQEVQQHMSDRLKVIPPRLFVA